MKKLGVIGGMGPLAGAYFMELAIEMTDASSDAENIEMEVLSVPSIPDRTGFILGESDDSPVPKILKLRDKLIEDGCGVIAIPCNTAVYFKNEYLTKDETVILNPIEETALVLKKMGIRKAGIMATDGTMKAGLFTEELSKHGIEAVESDEAHQKLIMEMIYGCVKAGKPIPKEMMDKAAGHLRDKGAEVIVLGCTELSIARKDGIAGDGFLDTLEVLAASSVKACGAKLRKESVNI